MPPPHPSDCADTKSEFVLVSGGKCHNNTTHNFKLVITDSDFFFSFFFSFIHWVQSCQQLSWFATHGTSSTFSSRCNDSPGHVIISGTLISQYTTVLLHFLAVLWDTKIVLFRLKQFSSLKINQGTVAFMKAAQHDRHLPSHLFPKTLFHSLLISLFSLHNLRRLILEL